MFSSGRAGLNSLLHHAYLLVGEVLEAEKFLASEFQTAGSPDYFVFKERVFGIDEARKLTALALRKAFGERKIFLIAPEKMTLQAQNALLKTFEDPIQDTHFFVVVREQGLIIPTLLSRMQVMTVEKGEPQELEAEKFLKLSIPKRLEFAKKFAEKESNLSAFLDHLLLHVRTAQVYKQRLVSDQQGASARLILEHLAVIL